MDYSLASFWSEEMEWWRLICWNKIQEKKRGCEFTDEEDSKHADVARLVWANHQGVLEDKNVFQCYWCCHILWMRGELEPDCILKWLGSEDVSYGAKEEGPFQRHCEKRQSRQHEVDSWWPWILENGRDPGFHLSRIWLTRKKRLSAAPIWLFPYTNTWARKYITFMLWLYNQTIKLPWKKELFLPERKECFHLWYTFIA